MFDLLPLFKLNKAYLQRYLINIVPLLHRNDVSHVP